MRFVLLVQPSNEEATLQSICLIRDLLVCLSGFATPEEAFGLSLLLPASDSRISVPHQFLLGTT